MDMNRKMNNELRILSTVLNRAHATGGTIRWICSYGRSFNQRVFGYGKTKAEAEADAKRAAKTKRGAAYLAKIQ